jgi:predicted nucleic acid-binding protein
LADLRNAVVDASAIFDTLVQPSPNALLAGLLARYDVTLHAPMLCQVEVAAAVRRALLRGHLADAGAARAIVRDLIELPVQMYPHERLLQRAVDLHANFTTYDGVYVALAEALSAPLLTTDARLAASTRTHTGVDVISTAI